MKVKHHIYLLAIIAICFSNKGKAQDIHYAQFHNVPLYQSPAMTGVMSADYRIAGVYRSQWESVPVQYKTFALGFDAKVLETKSGILAAGLLLSRDQAGDSNLSLTSATLSLAYTLKMGKKSLVTLGFNAGSAQRSFDFLKLTFDNQFNGDQFIAESSTGEDFGSTKNFYIDMGAGLNYRFQASRRTKFDIGVAGLHFNQPNQAFDGNDEINLPIRLTTYLNGSFRLSTKSDILIRGLLHKQSAYQEVAVGAGWRYHLSTKKSKETSIAFSTHYRLGDAIIPMIEVEYASWRAGFSYDINVSDFNIASSNRGGPEITLQYLITKVKRLPDYKSCPIF
jgi:type IX secretion system PorP/SprF family membrane protein